MAFKEMNVSEINENVFDMVGKKWMLITAAKNENDVNAMTASWGGLGILWGKPVAFIFIRPQRYTKEYIDSSDGLTLSFFDESYRKMLTYMGSASGRDENKIEHENLTVRFDGEAPYFEEASVVIKEKKLYRQELEPDCLIDTSIEGRWYPEHDWHSMYICEIKKVLIKE